MGVGAWLNVSALCVQKCWSTCSRRHSIWNGRIWNGGLRIANGKTNRENDWVIKSEGGYGSAPSLLIKNPRWPIKISYDGFHWLGVVTMLNARDGAVKHPGHWPLLLDCDFLKAQFAETPGSDWSAQASPRARPAVGWSRRITIIF